MANAVQTKLQKISGQYSAKVAEIRKLEADKRKPFVTDAQTKTINTQIKKLDNERLQINAELTKLTKLAKTAEEYLDLNKKLKELEVSIQRAEARGESTVSFKQQRTGATSRLKAISGEVELNFPEIKVTPPKIVTTTPKPGTTTTKAPTATTTRAPGLTTKAPGVTTPAPGVTTTAAPGVTTTAAPGATTAAPGATTTLPPQSLDTLLKKTEFWYDLPDYIFNTVPGLGDILVKAVSEGWDNEKFLATAKGTTWWQKNSSNLRTRIVDRAKYDELRAAGEDVTKTDYGLYLKKQMPSVKAKAREVAGVTLTDEQAQSISQKIYDGFLDDDPLAINALIVPFIGKVSSIAGTGTGAQGITGYSGQALQNYQTLQSIAKANGFGIKDILPGISTSTTGGDLETAVLQKLALGEIDINRVAQDARILASQGQPQYVRNLLNQGYDLENIYAPYKNQMAAVLEVNPDKIDLNDPTLRSAITDKGDMNLFDFKRQLRQDSRWQYTQSARDEVSSGAMKVLQDFGFQG
jgi:hypothetical protein